MARIITETQTTEIVLSVNGEDIISGMLEADGILGFEGEDGNTYYRMSDADADWWERWAEVEAMVLAAYDNATDEQREEHARLVQAYGHDFDMLHDAECELFGIDC